MLIFTLLLIAVIGIVVALVWMRRRRATTAHLHARLAQFQLSPLEWSIVQDLHKKDPTASDTTLLYYLFSKNIREDLKRTLGAHLMTKFNPLSMEGEHIQAFFEEERRAEQERVEAQRRFEEERRAEAQRRVQQPRQMPPPKNARLTPVAAANPFILGPQSVPAVQRRPEEYGILEFLTQDEIERQIRELNNIGRSLKQKHVYNSSQNVHAVNKGALDSAEKIITDYSSQVDIDSIENEVLMLIRNAPAELGEKIRTAVNTINESESKYGYGKEFTLKELFYCVITCIKRADRELQKELTQRLYEELSAMSKQCGTGHFVRLVNVFQGFYDNYALKLPIDSEIYARISTLAQKDIQQSDACDDLLIDPEALKDFLKKKQPEYLDQMQKEYSQISSRAEVEKSLRLALNKYTKSEVF